VKRRAYAEQTYWGRPVPSFGALDARLLIVGLAPGAHGANRTGRVFTGDSSGKFLYRALFETGFASQPESVSREDGMQLMDARITCAVHCAPPQNKPSPIEVRTCRGWLVQELALMRNLRVVVALGRIAFDAYLAAELTKGRPFGHNLQHEMGPDRPVLISSYHPSQQNTSTGKLTAAMLRDVFERARELVRR
jgi:uracil-DNA glycosylase family 4